MINFLHQSSYLITTSNCFQVYRFISQTPKHKYVYIPLLLASCILILIPFSTKLLILFSVVIISNVLLTTRMTSPVDASFLSTTNPKEAVPQNNQLNPSSNYAISDEVQEAIKSISPTVIVRTLLLS